MEATCTMFFEQAHVVRGATSQMHVQQTIRRVVIQDRLALLLRN
jgi:hypothetical protein